MGRPIDNERKGCKSSIHDHDIDRWSDVPDSDRGDFRRRRAVDISSLSTTAVGCAFSVCTGIETVKQSLNNIETNQGLVHSLNVHHHNANK